MPKYDFANILFAGPCNRFCPFCIGKEVAPHLNAPNLQIFPPRNWESFVDEIRRLEIGEIVFTGTTTDPHLYEHEAALIARVRRDLPTAKISIHTNGALSLKKIDVFNLYDRAVISFPSFQPDTYDKMMGSRLVPKLETLLASSAIPLKVSCIINEHNIAEIDDFLLQLSNLGAKRVVLRRLFGETRNWDVLRGRSPARYYRKNPVYTLGDMEITYWNFDTTESQSINLFADGTITRDYLLTIPKNA